MIPNQKLLYFILGVLTLALTIIYLKYRETKAQEIYVNYYPAEEEPVLMEMESENYKLEVMEIE